MVRSHVPLARPGALDRRLVLALWVGFGLIALGKATSTVDTIGDGIRAEGADWPSLFASLLLGNGAITVAAVAVYAGATARQLPSGVRMALLLSPLVLLALAGGFSRYLRFVL